MLGKAFIDKQKPPSRDRVGLHHGMNRGAKFLVSRGDGSTICLVSCKGISEIAEIMNSTHVAQFRADPLGEAFIGRG